MGNRHEYLVDGAVMVREILKDGTQLQKEQGEFHTIAVGSGTAARRSLP